MPSTHWRRGLVTIALLGLGAIVVRAGGVADPPAGWRPGVAGVARADEQDLPAGPIRERHELMEEIGKQAKALNGALKASDTAGVAPPAEAIARLAGRIVKLFPEGSTNPKSRAKPEIWQKFDQFEALAGQLETSSSALAVAAKAGADVQALAAKVMKTCKGCHENFRTPKKDEQ
jgi:cytochrome c556